MTPLEIVAKAEADVERAKKSHDAARAAMLSAEESDTPVERWFEQRKLAEIEMILWSRARRRLREARKAAGLPEEA